MSVATNRVVTPEWITALVRATFGGEPPPVVAALVHAEMCAEHYAGSKLGAVFTVQGGDERPRVRVGGEGEGERVLDVVKAQVPAVAGLLAGAPLDDALYETDGSAWRVYAMGGDGGRNDVGRVLDGADEFAIVPHEAFPAGALPDAIVAQARDFAAAVGRGTWFALTAGGLARTLVWVSENAWTPELDDQVAALGGGERLAAARQVFAEAGLRVQPYSVEFDGASVHVCLWGAHTPRGAGDLPSIFADGLPTAEAFAAELVLALPDRDQEAGLALVRDHVYPVVRALTPADQEPGAYAADAWRALLELLAFEAPFDRLGVLRGAHAVNRLAGLQVEALQLALARYVQTHDVQPPATLSDAYAGLDAAAIKARAAGLKAESESLFATVEGHGQPENLRLPGASYEAGTIASLLERALTGEFAAAEGQLHDFIVTLGPTAYDEPLELMDLDGIDLELDRDAVIEEALAAPDDEDEG